MDSTQDKYEAVKHLYRHAEWRVAGGCVAINSLLPVLGPRHGLRLEKRLPISFPRGMSERYIQPDDPNVRVLIDISIHASVEEARDSLLGILEKISAPRLPTCEERGRLIGDVGFCGVGNPVTSVVFVRQNVLIQIRSIGKVQFHVFDVAADIDAQVCRLSGAAPPLNTREGSFVTQYSDLFSRDNFGDTGIVPSTGNPCMSPDIVPLQSGTLTWPQVQASYNGPDIGRDIKNGSVNNIYVRAKNLSPSEASSGTVALYYSKASVLLVPSSWTQITAPAGQGTLPLVDSAGNTVIVAQALAITQSPFLLTGLPPASNDHYCLVSVIQTLKNHVEIPSSFASNAAFAQWVQNTPAVAWRNLSVVPNAQTQIVRTYTFGNLNPTGAYFYFSFVGSGYPKGTGIEVQCTDPANPIQWSDALPEPDINGNQNTGFQHWGAANYSGILVVTLTSVGGTFPSGAKLHFRFYQVPTTDDTLHRSVGRLVAVAQSHRTLGPQTFTAFLIPLGECTFIVA